MDLVSLASRNSLPDHQFIDAATVEWIAGHHGLVPAGPAKSAGRLPHAVRGILGNAPIPVHWHAEPRIAESIHGTRHLLRTAALSAVLAGEHGLDAERTRALVLAAALHDCRRVHDNDDRGHGERGAVWFRAMAGEIADFFGVRCGAPQVEQAAVAIRLHERPYRKFTEDDRRDRSGAQPVVDLLKTADALDRYRLPKLAWWPRQEYLVVRPGPWLCQLAFSLVVDSERRYLEGVPGAEAVRAALTGRGLL